MMEMEDDATQSEQGGRGLGAVALHSESPVTSGQWDPGRACLTSARVAALLFPHQRRAALAHSL